MGAYALSSGLAKDRSERPGKRNAPRPPLMQIRVTRLECQREPPPPPPPELMPPPAPELLAPPDAPRPAPPLVPPPAPVLAAAPDEAAPPELPVPDVLLGETLRPVAPPAPAPVLRSDPERRAPSPPRTRALTLTFAPARSRTFTPMRSWPPRTPKRTLARSPRT